ncbi:MAG: ARPP-1 family domain-containing protein [Acidimicrobiia bacterium]
MVEDLRPVDGQRGVLVVTSGGVVAVDLFDKPATLAAYWDGLLSGYALDSLGGRSGRERRGGTDPAAFGAPEARAFLDQVLRTEATEAAAVALGTEVHFGDDDVTGGALVWDGAVVHLAAFGASAGALGR